MKAFTVAGFVLAGALVTACSREVMGPTSGAPISATVTLSPMPGATDVSRGAPIEVHFGNAMDSTSCASRFTLHRGDTSGVAVPGRMTWDRDHQHMRFMPDSMMAPGTQYYVHMRDSMMTRESMMSGSTIHMGGMGGVEGGEHRMSGSPMMFDQPPAGARRARDGMRWSFTTGS